MEKDPAEEPAKTWAEGRPGHRAESRPRALAKASSASAPAMASSGGPAKPRAGARSSAKAPAKAAPKAQAKATDVRLLEVAIDHFGRHGLTGASTRAIAKDADTPMSSITYHFGGKQGLYLAAARHIGDLLGRRVAPAIAEADRVFKGADANDPAAVRAALMAVYEHMVLVLASADAAPIARFIIREQADPTEAFTLIYDAMMEPLLKRVARLLTIVAHGRFDDTEARLRAVALMGQVLVFRVARETALRAAGWTDIGADELAIIQRIVADHLSAVLDRLASGAR